MLIGLKFRVMDSMLHSSCVDLRNVAKMEPHSENEFG